MTPYEFHVQHRFSLIPEEIRMLAHTNATVHAAISAWVERSESVEWLLTRIILLMASNINNLESRLTDQLRKAPRTWTM